MKTIYQVTLFVFAAFLWTTAFSTEIGEQTTPTLLFGPQVSMFAQAQSLNLLPGDAAIAPAAGDQTAPAIARAATPCSRSGQTTAPTPISPVFTLDPSTKRRETSMGFASTPPVTSSTPSRSRSRPAVRTRTIRRFAGTAPTGSSCIKASMSAAPAITTRTRSKPCACRPPARCSTPNRSNFLA